MLIGCCHCDEPSESSIPSEPSVSEPSVSESTSSVLESSVIDLSVRDVDCGECDAFPFKWKITLTGWTGAFPAHNTCCSSISGIYVIPSVTSLTVSLPRPFGNYCRVWASNERAKNHNSATNVSPPCGSVTSVPQVALGALSSGVDTVWELCVYYPFGFTTHRHAFTTRGPNYCFYNGSLTYDAAASSVVTFRCAIGTVQIEPAT